MKYVKVTGGDAHWMVNVSSEMAGYSIRELSEIMCLSNRRNSNMNKNDVAKYIKTTWFVYDIIWINFRIDEIE